MKVHFHLQSLMCVGVFDADLLLAVLALLLLISVGGILLEPLLIIAIAAYDLRSVSVFIVLIQTNTYGKPSIKHRQP